jgi:hypothetical protein
MTNAAEPPPPTVKRPWATHVLIPTLWTPEPALAVCELLDDLLDAVGNLYARQIQDLLRDEQGHGDAADVTAGGDDPADDRPF